MPNIDIPVPVNLQKLFQLPPCEEIKLPLPSPISIQLPSGGSLKAFTDISSAYHTFLAYFYSWSWRYHFTNTP